MIIFHVQVAEWLSSLEMFPIFNEEQTSIENIPVTAWKQFGFNYLQNTQSPKAQK